MNSIGAGVREFLYRRAVVEELYRYLLTLSNMCDWLAAARRAAIRLPHAAFVHSGKLAEAGGESDAKRRRTGDDGGERKEDEQVSASSRLTAACDDIEVDTSRPSLPLLLRVLTGVAKRHAPSQEVALSLGVVHMLHRIEGVSAPCSTALSHARADAGIASTSKVGPIAESALASIQDASAPTAALLDVLRKQTRDKVRNSLRRSEPAR
jgi:hypothetical protein